MSRRSTPLRGLPTTWRTNLAAKRRSALGILTAYRQKLMQGTRRVPGSGYRLPDPTRAEFFPALFDTIERFDLPVPLFTDLLSAFEQDVTTSRYETWSELLDYCRRSANPIGRIVLGLSGYRDEALDRASDDVCTALQLTNFWQDLAVDWSRGRLYVPEEVWLPHGATIADLTAGTWTPAWQAALVDCGQRTRALFERGPPGLRRRVRAPPLRAPRHLARRHADSRSARDRPLQCLRRPPFARPGGLDDYCVTPGDLESVTHGYPLVLS